MLLVSHSCYLTLMLFSTNDFQLHRVPREGLKKTMKLVDSHSPHKSSLGADIPKEGQSLALKGPGPGVKLWAKC